MLFAKLTSSCPPDIKLSVNPFWAVSWNSLFRLPVDGFALLATAVVAPVDPLVEDPLVELLEVEDPLVELLEDDDELPVDPPVVVKGAPAPANGV